MLDNFYISVFNFYKARLGKRANRVALFYINLLETSIYLAFGAFSLAFANQMNIATITMFKFWVIIGLVTLFIMFKNWMRYNGKKRNILNAKSRSKTPSIYLLWLLPIGCIVLAFVFLQVLA